jgi:S1-C subfamily serine protease
MRPRLSIATLLLAAIFQAQAATPSPGDKASAAAAVASPEGERAARAVLDAVDAVVRIKVTAVADARSLRTLGRAREGSGIQIAPSGLILTIGYLVLEADSIEVTDNTGKTVSATVAAYDHASGFGLVKPNFPLNAKGASLGDSGEVGETEKLIFATHGGKESASLATVVSKRRFAGYWEYLIDDAIFTVPPRGDHSGAALINREGKVVGIGSLIVADAAAPNRRVPGNMFVPIDLVKPIVAEVASAGTARETARPWIGLSTQEVEGRLFVLRVQEDSPAAAAGLKTGDIILGIGGDKVGTLEQFYKRLWSAGKPGAAIRLNVLQGTSVRDIDVRSIDRQEYIRGKASL